MLQRYDITLDGDAKRLSIKEYAVIGRALRKSEYYNSTQESYSLIYEVSYSSDDIRAAIKKGQEALISELRSDDFFPIYPLVKIMAGEVIKLFNGNLDHFSQLFFDDRTLLSEDNEK